MKIKQKIIIGICAVFASLLASCSPEENIVNAGEEYWTLLTVFSATNEIQNAKIQNAAIESKSIRYTANNAIESIFEYRNYLFLMMPESNKMEILDRATYQLLTVVDFSQSKRKPCAIAFANATTAYIAQRNDSVVTIYDLQNFKIAGDIPVGKNPIAIHAGIGDRQNQIFVANYSSNTVSQIDSRLNRVVALYDVIAGPRFIENDPTGTKMVVACEGAGKHGGIAKPSMPGMAFIDIDRKLILAQTTISTRKSDSAEAYPLGLAVTKSEWAFVPMSNGLLRVDTREYKNYSTISQNVYSWISFNQRRNELIFCKDNEVSIINENSGVLKHAPIVLEKPVLCAIGQ